MLYDLQSLGVARHLVTGKEGAMKRTVVTKTPQEETYTMVLDQLAM